jgi:hypothetical protein
MPTDPELERAREGVAALTDAACPGYQADAALDALEQAVRQSERVAVAARIQAHEWGLFVHQGTVDRITDFILEGDQDD